MSTMNGSLTDDIRRKDFRRNRHRQNTKPNNRRAGGNQPENTAPLHLNVSPCINKYKKSNGLQKVDANQCATDNPYSTASTSACQEASMMLALAPTVLHSRVVLRVSINTRVMASVPFWPSKIRTL